MVTQQRWWILLLGLFGCAGDSRRPEETKDYGYIQGTNRVWVQGPWDVIRPSRDVDEVIDQLCPALMDLPGARDRNYGREYCGAVYSLGDGVYYASKPSSLRGVRTVAVNPEEEKACFPPREVRDLRGKRPSIIADFHGHPWANSRMSARDRRLDRQIWQIRIQFDTVCHIQKLIPYADADRPGELYERQGKAWKLIAHIKLEDKETGRLTYVDE